MEMVEFTSSIWLITPSKPAVDTALASKMINVTVVLVIGNSIQPKRKTPQPKPKRREWYAPPSTGQTGTDEAKHGGHDEMDQSLASHNAGTSDYVGCVRELGLSDYRV